METERLKEILKNLQTLSRQVTQLGKHLREYLKQAEKEEANPFVLEQALKKIERAAEKIEGASDLKRTIRQWITQERALLEPLKQRYRWTYFQRLQKALQSLPLNLTGQDPTFYAGLYTFRPNFERGTLRIFWGPEEIGQTPLEPERVVQTLRSFEQRLNTPFQAEEFFQQLLKAYRRVLQDSPSSQGRAPLLQILRHLVLLRQPSAFWADPSKRHFREYTRIQFAYDLYRLRRSRYGNRIQLVVATFDQTRDPQQALFIPDGPEKGTRYAYLVIQNAETH